MSIREKVTGALTLPKEIALDLPLVTALGRGEVSIENYKNLLAFTDTRIRIHTSSGLLTIEGARLQLKQITTETLVITGQITSVNWGD